MAARDGQFSVCGRTGPGRGSRSGLWPRIGRFSGLACGCGGTGRRARFRSVWANARDGSTPFSRIDGNGSASLMWGRFALKGGKDGSAVRLDTVSPLEGRGTQNANALRSLGAAFGLVAAGLVVLATFMARLSCTTIDLSHDRLIGRTGGLFFLRCAGVMIIGAIASIRDRRAGWVLVLAGLAIVGLTIYSATGSRSLI